MFFCTINILRSQFDTGAQTERNWPADKKHRKVDLFHSTLCKFQTFNPEPSGPSLSGAVMRSLASDCGENAPAQQETPVGENKGQTSSAESGRHLHR